MRRSYDNDWDRGRERRRYDESRDRRRRRDEGDISESHRRRLRAVLPLQEALHRDIFRRPFSDSWPDAKARPLARPTSSGQPQEPISVLESDAEADEPEPEAVAAPSGLSKT